jgi:HSP20 family protein
MFTRRHSAGYGSAYSGKETKASFPTAGGWYRRPKYNVPVNIAETESSYEVTVYAVGFAKENIKLIVVDDILYISGTRSIEEKDEPSFTKQEFPVKTFERMISLNGQVDISKIKARQENDILSISLPKSPEAQKPAQEIKVD